MGGMLAGHEKAILSSSETVSILHGVIFVRFELY